MSRNLLAAGIVAPVLCVMSANSVTAEFPAFIHTTDSENLITDPSFAADGRHMTRLDHELTNGKPGQLIFVSQIYGKYNPHQIGAWYYNHKWTIYNQDQARMPVDTSFSVLSLDPTQTRNAFQHRATPRTTSGSHVTRIDHPLTNGNPNAFLLVTPVFGHYDTNPIGVWYDGAQWTVFHQNHQLMRDGSLFNVLVVQPGANRIAGHAVAALMHRATPATIDPEMTWVTTTTNAERDTIPFLTQNWNPNQVNDQLIPALWFNGKWTVFNQDRVPLPENAAFHILHVSTRPSKPIPGRVDLTFFNATSSRVNVYWIDYDGKEQLYHELDTGKSVQQETGYQHNWVVRESATGKELKRHIATRTEQVVIKDAGRPPVTR